MGTLGTIFTSLDGNTWTEVEFPETLNDVTEVDAIVYTGSTWIGFARADNTTVIITSPDAITLNRPDCPNMGETDQAACGNGIIVGGGDLGFLISTDDGVSWASQSYSDDNYFLPLVAFGNDVFLAVQTISHSAGPLTIQRSNDGTTWTNVATMSDVGHAYQIAFVNGQFYILGTGTDLSPAAWYSTDGVTWTKISLPALSEGNRYIDIAYGNSMYVILPSDTSTRMCSSTDGITFSSITDGDGLPNFGWHSLTFGHGLFVAVSNDGDFVLEPSAIVSSADAITWTLYVTDHNVSFFDVLAR